MAKIDAKTNLPATPEGYAWVVQTLRVQDFTWLPWFPMGQLLIGLERSHPFFGTSKISPLSDDKAHAFKNHRAMVAACNRILTRRARRLKRVKRPLAIRVQQWFEKSSEKATLREKQKSAKLAQRDADWIGTYPPRRLP